jgi:hypothetical protein
VAENLREEESEQAMKKNTFDGKFNFQLAQTCSRRMSNKLVKIVHYISLFQCRCHWVRDKTDENHYQFETSSSWRLWIGE